MNEDQKPVAIINGLQIFIHTTTRFFCSEDHPRSDKEGNAQHIYRDIIQAGFNPYPVNDKVLRLAKLEFYSTLVSGSNAYPWGSSAVDHALWPHYKRDVVESPSFYYIPAGTRVYVCRQG